MGLSRFFFKAAFTFHLFSVSSNTSTILKQINWVGDPSSIQCRVLNSQPPDFQSPPTTTRPGLQISFLVWCHTYMTMKIVNVYLEGVRLPESNRGPIQVCTRCLKAV